MTNADATRQRLEEAEPLREPALRAIIESLQLPTGSHGLDVGCGIGRQARLFAETAGRVTGLDFSLPLLRYARVRAPTKRVSFGQGDMYRLPFANSVFDWAWSADCAGYPAGELLPVLREMRRVVRPGGWVVILAWTSQQLLPGYPLLEARLNATCSAFAPYVRGQPPESHFLRALDVFHRAGFSAPRAQTFVGEAQAPLNPALRQSLTSLLEMLWGDRQPETAEQDWRAYQRLCRPESPDFVLNQPGYYAFFTYTVFRADR
jgi:demethylmenaquinone methyltransferase/2-methoxy-6-polyprenyl-1,4-benzoquinol methylase